MPRWIVANWYPYPAASERDAVAVEAPGVASARQRAQGQLREIERARAIAAGRLPDPSCWDVACMDVHRTSGSGRNQ